MNIAYTSIKYLNKRLFEDIKGNFPFGLAYGKMGIIIYLYHLYSYTQESIYKKKADFFLDYLLENGLSQNTNLTVEDGLCGISLGLEHLIDNHFVDGDINVLSKEIDCQLFQQIVFQKNEYPYSLSEKIHWAYYLHKRIEKVTDKEELFILEELIMKLVNQISLQIDSSLFVEYCNFSMSLHPIPILLRIIISLSNREQYSDRLIKILEYISFYLFSHMPRLHLNRLYLLWGVLPVRKKSSLWLQYADSLKSNIDLNIILEREIRERDIYFSNGLPYLYLLLEDLKLKFPEYSFRYDPYMIYCKIINSDAWKALKNKSYYYQIHHGLLNGFPSSVLTLLDIKKNYS